ncbi:MAG: pseudouridine-5'-phosphate glycosidase [Chloroflexota bacterium]|nr:pseudouridine-5'-phosphate glycosidase [Chloroflexota bacterium]
MARATGGQSLEANLALLENDARVGAEIAVALSRGH